MDERAVRRLLVVLGVVLVALATARCGQDNREPGYGIVRSGGSIDDVRAATAANPAANPAPPASSQPDSVTQPTQGTAGTLVADRDQVAIPRRYATGVGPDGSLSGYAGLSAVGTRLLVRSVPADEGFWVTDPRDRDAEPVWVQLIGPPPESPYDVDAGDTVTFTGRFVAHGSTFAQSVGVTPSEGAARLTAQDAHVRVDMQDLTLYPLTPG